MKILLIILGIIGIISIYVVITYNEFISLQNQIEEAFSTMDVYLVKRSDLIPNLVATVKGYTKHESETLEKIVNARSKAINAGSSNEKIAAENEITSAISKLFALAEAYPDLKANQNFLSLQADLKSVEGEVSNARKYYNGVVREYNTMIRSIPSNIIASLMKLEKASMFEVSDEKKRENVKVEF